jgi:hypothetical protein
MKTRTGNKVKNKKNNIHNEKGWLALNGLANLYFLFLENNSSLKFEIMAKQLYVASQRVL